MNGLHDELPAGLAITRNGDGWAITHKRSGLGVAWLEALPDAAALAAELGTVGVDWTRPGDALVGDPATDAARAVIAQWDADHMGRDATIEELAR